MHDGAWLAAALVNAHRAAGEPFYKSFLTRRQVPFYCKMLNHSDELFSAKTNNARKSAKPFDKEHALQEGEKGFVPYFWDDGGSVSLERRRDKDPLGPFPCFDRLAGKDNPEHRLDGYSLGSSNHLAQDLGVMLQQAWLLLRESPDDADRKLAAEVAEAARNLHECRMRHFGHIPMCDAPSALAAGDARLMAHVPDQSGPAVMEPGNHYFRALYDFKPGQRYPTPGFADDQEYRYYSALAKHGGTVPKALAFRLIYDAYTEPLLYRSYSDDAEVPPGINRFDLHPIYFKDGKPEDYRSDRKGPGGKPRPIGSRLGPQNLVVCGWGLQLLREYPGLWDERARAAAGKDALVPIVDALPGMEEVKTPPAALTVGGAELKLRGTRSALEVEGTAKTEELTLKLFSRPDGKGGFAAVTVKKDGAAAVNDKGEKLQLEVQTAEKGGLTFRLRLPYTAAKGQKAWANGVEHGRLSVQVGDEARNLYLASPEAQVKAWLERELGGGLRTWEAIFRAQGYVPTGIGAGEEWDDFSDAGGYAHLISAAAEWVLYREGKKDWEAQRVPGLERSK
jgi:hypothetical protein